MKTVYVVGGDPDVRSMFRDEGWQVETQLNEAKKLFDHSRLSLVVFTGGEDVSPYVYGEEAEGARGCNPIRDDFEVSIYYQFLNRAPFVGICRGGQLLNVLNGGKMIQDLGKTVSGVKSAIYFPDGPDKDPSIVEVLVDHHQGILLDKDRGILLGFYDALSPLPAYFGLYPETKSLCFQPHPEWGHEPTKSLFFKLLREYLNV